MWFHDDVYLPIPFGLCWFCFLLIIKVTKVARMLAAKPTDNGSEQQKSCTVMALLDGGMLKRHRMWLKVLSTFLVNHFTFEHNRKIFHWRISIKHWYILNGGIQFCDLIFNCMFTSYNKKKHFVYGLVANGLISFCILGRSSNHCGGYCDKFVLNAWETCFRSWRNESSRNWWGNWFFKNLFFPLLHRSGTQWMIYFFNFYNL